MSYHYDLNLIVYYFSLFILINLSCYTISQESQPEKHFKDDEATKSPNIAQTYKMVDDQQENQKENAGVAESIDNIIIYRALFKQKRREQLEALKRIIEMDAFEKQYKIVFVITEKIFKILVESRDQLLINSITAGDPIPMENEKLKNVYSSVLENTAFLGEIALRLPDITKLIFDKNSEWRLIIEWAIDFSKYSQVFVDADAQLLHLMSQELNIIKREETYFNPYSKQVQEEVLPTKKEKKKKKKAIKRGPRLSRGSLHTEL